MLVRLTNHTTGGAGWCEGRGGESESEAITVRHGVGVEESAFEMKMSRAPAVGSAR